MDNQSFVPDSIPADLNNKSWHIPRPTLARSSDSSQGSTSSKSSTQSDRSGASLLTASNLAQIHHQEVATSATASPNHGGINDGNSQMSTRDQNIQYYLERSHKDSEFLAALPKTDKLPDPDNVSVASSMHFTVVNVNTRQKTHKRGFCRRHQLTVLVMTMCSLFTIAILTAIFLLEMRAKKLQN